MKTTTLTPDRPSLFLGIDVGKKDLFCHIIGTGQTISRRFDNTHKGIVQLIAWLCEMGVPSQIRACLEQTGHYGDVIAEALYEMGIAGLYLVNPQRIKAFGMQKLRRNKSDTADAKLIARFLKAEHSELRTWQPRSLMQQKITALSRHADSLTKEAAKLKTMLEGCPDKHVTASLGRMIRMLQKEIKALRERIKELIQNSPELSAKNELIQTIPGIGVVAAQTVLAELPDITQFENARQLAAWVGLTPRHFVSGTSGKTRTPITKIGSVQLRRGLFMPAMTARVFNPLLKTFADRLIANGKKPKQVIIAVMRKLLHQIYGILKSGIPYNPEKRGFAGT
ncbi:MAG: IS110 family transposase [Luteolibacter sp.]